MPHLCASCLADCLAKLYSGLPLGIIFDCDGVVIDSKEANIAYYNYLRAYIGLPKLTHEQEDFVHAATVHQAIDAICPKPLRPLLKEASRRISYMRDIMPRITCHKGLHDVLDFCREHRVRLAMNSNRTDGIDMILNNCRLNGYFDPIVLASHVARPKPYPDGALFIMNTWKIPASSILFIGDSQSDLDAAKNAGIPFLAFQTEGLSSLSAENFPTLLQALKSLLL